ncbi:MAG: EAL domain-containing protein [Gammaproteobacteria bacterium]|nr:EAL domain-containing protein [Gammaproteobacteria bacterium]
MTTVIEKIITEKPTVFVVDDNEDVNESMRWLIEPVGYEVKTYSDPALFLKSAEFPKPSCIILDIRMPKINGLKLQEMLQERHVTVPIVFMTGHGDVPMTVRAMKMGAYEFLVKPVNSKVLLKTISKAVEKDIEGRFKTKGEISRRKVLEEALRFAIERDELFLEYQPIYQTYTRRIIGFEALARWLPSKMPLVSPVEFIPIAEETGLIVPIGQWVLEKACTQYMTWQKEGHKNYRLSVNLSVHQIIQPHFLNEVLSAISKTGMSASNLELEVTETALITRLEEVQASLRELKALGVRISVDDFGMGYSSLGHLKDLSCDTLKIDKSFIQEIGKDENSAVIIQSVIALAHALGLAVVGEGVETEEQFNFLLMHNCHYVQGFYFSKPLSPQQLKSILKLK